MMSKKDIQCLLFKMKQCAVGIAYEIVLKEPKGYPVVDLKSKLAYLYSLIGMVEDCSCGCSKKIKDGYIQICGGKILPSKNNPLLLKKLDSTKESQGSESCCVSLCEIESKFSSICINC